MSLVDIGGAGFLYPSFGPHAIRLDGHGTGYTIDASGEKAAVIFRVPKSGNIDRTVFTVRNLTTSQTIRGGLETVSATDGFPTGTQYGGSAVGTQTSPAANTQYEITLGTPAAATAGDVVAAVFQFDSTVGNLQISGVDGLAGSTFMQTPYSAQYTTSWAKGGGMLLMVGIRYDDGTYEHIGTWPMGIRIDTFFTNASTPDEIGNYFTVPTYLRASAIYTGIGNLVAGGTQDYVLYEGTTAIETITLDTDQAITSATGIAILPFTTRRILKPNTGYRVTLKAGANNANVREAPFINAAMRQAMPGGANVYKTSRTDAGSFTEDTTRVILSLGLMIDQIHGPAQNQRLRRAA